MPSNFEDLKIWQNSHKLMLSVYQIISQFPKKDFYALISQLRRSSLSVPANIAEAHGRYHYLDKIKFLLNARGSIEETRSHLRAAIDLELLNQKDFERLNLEYIGLLRGLNSFIASLKRKNQLK